MAGLFYAISNTETVFEKHGTLKKRVLNSNITVEIGRYN